MCKGKAEKVWNLISSTREEIRKNSTIVYYNTRAAKSIGNRKHTKSSFTNLPATKHLHINKKHDIVEEIRNRVCFTKVGKKATTEKESVQNTTLVSLKQ